MAKFEAVVNLNVISCIKKPGCRGIGILQLCQNLVFNFYILKKPCLSRQKPLFYTQGHFLEVGGKMY